MRRCNADDLNKTMDWLPTFKAAIDTSLAGTHLKNGSMDLHGVPSRRVAP